MSHHHHSINMILTVLGMTIGAATFIPGSEFRSWALFGLSAACSICYLLMNGKHVIQSLKNWRNKD